MKIEIPFKIMRQEICLEDEFGLKIELLFKPSFGKERNQGKIEKEAAKISNAFDLFDTVYLTLE